MKNSGDINLDSKTIKNILINNYYQKAIQDIDVDINHLEKIFTDKTYYLAMKIVPLLERKVLYLSYIENVRLNEICTKLKINKKDVISLRKKGIIHFKNNLRMINKSNNLEGGDKNV